MLAHKEKYWSKFARTFDEDQEYVVGKTILQAIDKRLSEECYLRDVIEFGCGTG
jgi:predicted TPR repeat methyltransferase